MKTKSKYSSMPLQTISRKVWSSFIDGLLLLILGVIITLTLGFETLKNNDEFSKYNTQCFDNINEMYQIQNDAKLQIISSQDEKKVLATADYFDAYIIKQIRLSYINFEKEFNNQNIYLEIEDNNYSSLDNDELSYYFVKYKLEKNININDYNNQDSLTYFKEEILFKNINKDYYIDRENDLPIIKSDIAIKLYQHYADIEYNQDLYYEFSDAVLEIRNIGLNDLSTYSVFNEHYLLYEEAYLVMKKYDNIASLFSYLLAFIIVILLPYLFTKNGVTLGRLLTRTRTIHIDDFDIGIIRKLLILLLTFIIYLFIVIFISLFTFGFENLTFVLFRIGTVNISFLHLLLIGFVFMILNFAFIAITYDHHSLIDMVTNTKQMDTTTFIEPR